MRIRAVITGSHRLHFKVMIAEKKTWACQLAHVTYAKGSTVSLIIRAGPLSCDVHFRLQREYPVYILSV